jgi:hypothetical protein
MKIKHTAWQKKKKKKIKRQHAEWEKKFVSHISDKGLVTRIIKNYYNSATKREITHLKTGQRI